MLRPCLIALICVLVVLGNVYILQKSIHVFSVTMSKSEFVPSIYNHIVNI